MLVEWDADLLSLVHLAKGCNHDYSQGEFCEKCGWEKGSHRRIGAGPGDHSVPVSPPFPDATPGSAPQDPRF